MKIIHIGKRQLVALLGAAALLAVGPAQAAGLLTPVGQSTPLAIRDHAVRVIVEDGYVVTEVEQTFANTGSRDLEALYSFPVPEHAAVGEFTYWIDGQPVTGEVVERQRARDIYEAEKSAGRETALVEKNDYRTFEIGVYPVRAGQDVRTRLVYLQTAHTDTGVGRYVYPLAEGGVDEIQMAFWDTRDAVEGTFSFDLELKSSYPVDALRVPDQPGAQLTQIGPGHWQVRLGSAGGDAELDAQITALEEGTPVPVAATARLDTDIVVYWRHQPNLPGSIDLVTYKPDPDSRGTFMLTLTPGDDLPPITTGRDWVFVLDTSGSMQGKFATLAEGVEQALGELRPEDRFNIVTFSDNARELTHGFIPSTPANVQRYIAAVRGLQANGSTNLHDGLTTGLRSLDTDRPSGVILVTDGVANVGVTDKRRFLQLLEQHDVRLFTFIMGNSANRPL
ncbi:MAG: VIT and VWA domain-containing protein, partial [Gammaproteobacteria bacterium]|nr:VIT and VWA domain-containing protein [Gammaproteobacteria bacterium]